ncbi:hypothetical protein DNU06_14470 [Putridiphycobacter roseus]|uniref:Uncharacterized protein n=1 Tax=Putridiphycobacter roseus TaxID=2219161 RepID=A0A2W1MXR2_9FLAO|nr:hypothetical protein [Putridiphycobacter roseus]PZE16164.1 hypothetical protein DNU06_14470 [Putridiphycobacter roseus]
MNYTVSLNSIKTTDNISGFWTTTDYKNLLEACEIDDMDGLSDNDIQEVLFMALTELDTVEAAKILLTYKFADRLNKGQIEQMAHDMIVEDLSQEYADISFHFALFEINQLLYKAFNGKFPHSKASIIEFEVKQNDKSITTFNKSSLLKLLRPGLSEHSVLRRLFDNSLASTAEFVEAENIIWQLEQTETLGFKLTTSKYWLDGEDFILDEFEAKN